MDNTHRLIFGLLVTFLLIACDNTESTKLDAGKIESEAIATLEPERKQPAAFKTVEWTDLMPAEDLDALLNPPSYVTEIEDGSEADQLVSQLKAGINVAEDRYQQALISKNIRPEFNGRHIRIPGFIVPLEFDDQQTITTFFFVPFFGACIHVPPPPPNQIIYAEFETGIHLNTLYEPFWINGILSTTLMENEMATAAYSITVSAIEPYTE